LAVFSEQNPPQQLLFINLKKYPDMEMDAPPPPPKGLAQNPLPSIQALAPEFKQTALFPNKVRVAFAAFVLSVCYYMYIFFVVTLYI
jgi:hypothetical protein